MAHLTEIYIKAETLEILAKTVRAKNEKGLSITIATQDEANQWNQNVAAYVSQSKEDREAKKDRYYVGNGKCFWSDGKPPFVPQKEDKPKVQDAVVLDDSDGLPF